MNGMVFKRGAEGEIKKSSNAKLAIFACPFDLTQTETKAIFIYSSIIITDTHEHCIAAINIVLITFFVKGTVLMNTADDLLKFGATEEAEVEKQVKALADLGVTVVVSAGKFGDLYIHFLNKFKIMGVRMTSKFDLRRLCLTTGAQAQAQIVRTYNFK